jgi:hypothetical protein
MTEIMKQDEFDSSIQDVIAEAQFYQLAGGVEFTDRDLQLTRKKLSTAYATALARIAELEHCSEDKGKNIQQIEENLKDEHSILSQGFIDRINRYDPEKELERSPWINVKDKLPPFAQRVLVYMANDYIVIASRLIDAWRNDAGSTCIKILYWMPIPESPKGNK